MKKKLGDKIAGMYIGFCIGFTSLFLLHDLLAWMFNRTLWINW